MYLTPLEDPSVLSWHIILLVLISFVWLFSTYDCCPSSSIALFHACFRMEAVTAPGCFPPPFQSPNFCVNTNTHSCNGGGAGDTLVVVTFVYGSKGQGRIE